MINMPEDGSEIKSDSKDAIQEVNDILNTSVIVNDNTNVESGSALSDIPIINRNDCVEEQEEVGSLESNGNNIPKVSSVEDSSNEQNNLQNDKVTSDNDIKPDMANDDTIFENGSALSDVKIMNRSDSIQKQEEVHDLESKGNNIAKNGSAKNVSDLRGDLQKDIIISDSTNNAEIPNDNVEFISQNCGVSNERNSVEDDKEASCSKNNIAGGSRSDNADLVKPIKVDNGVREEEDEGPYLEIYYEEVFIDDDKCTEIINIHNKILEFFPDVEETHLYQLCLYYSTKGSDALDTILNTLSDGYPKRHKSKEYYVSKIKEILPTYDDEHLNYLANNIKSDEALNKFIRETREKLKVPDPIEVTTVDQNLVFDCIYCANINISIDVKAYCSNGCYCCKTCLVNYMVIHYSEGFVNLMCMERCGGTYTLSQVEDSMNPITFKEIEKLLQQREIEEANIDNLHRCPFCDYAAIAEEDVFNCSECERNSCILCKRESHPTFRCNEVETDEEVRKRTDEENRLTDSLIISCPKCNIKIILEEGCNKITCSCGTMLCYICRAIVQDYTHFNPDGGTFYHLCPLRG